MIESNLNTTNSKFDHKNNWENFNLGVSAYQKERKGDLKGAIKDISLVIKNENVDYFNFYYRGKLFFKIKNYEKAIDDLSKFISIIKKKYKLYKCSVECYVESLFLKECCLIILKVEHQNELQSTLRTLHFNDQYLYGSKLGDNYVNFLIALGFATKKHFEWSLEHLLKIRDSDQDFLKNKYSYLLEHLPKEMKPILALCWHII